jgi:MHS family metabolite:H+ symporter-like MFS transporter
MNVPASASESSTPDTRQLRRAIFTGAVGSALEYYDFALYGLASALVFGKIFFPSLGTTGALLASFATYGAGFLARPFGGLFFGSLGDRKGRKLVLLLTIGLMGLATTLIGLLPTGSAGAVLLVILRLLQGFGAGAEQSGAATLMAELAPPKRCGFYAALPFIGVFSGLALATITFRVMQALLKESPVFKQLAESKNVIQSPMRAVLRGARRPLLAASLMRLAETGCSTLYTTVSIAFLTGFAIKHSADSGANYGTIGTNAVLWASLVSIITTPLFGALSDRVGRLMVYRAGAVFTALWAFPAWWMIDTGNPTLVAIATVGGFAVGANSMLGAQCAHFTELFGNRYRYSGVALSREVGAMLSGGLVPILGIFLVGIAGGAYWVLAAYTVVLAALTMVGTLLSTETRGRSLTDLTDAIGSGAVLSEDERRSQQAGAPA